uniref:Uncharacterized protein n=1 Tax=Chromera velia CCMP2878 TaxID=1169474 RepID=A0A0G4HJM8_9ALVE|mmetsp:Transcript_36694/g.72192  ORF Transcript_36694/g.72192 Transcript_36694/m.72192 type:complete len:382 (+) Transcript_36694:107-1252(+)|eukprot:Cvel_7144.t1-p1 / transcript=Cvel_7144.t1 / gene=Cvel_7144 / organism=Chromera_velia_CCMP2878 / gene_product=hypothetical protein / transcript_product=hypothetical protein / location=Cvel_scaffold367:17261-18888(+) / protein_length=381 / sequence_SO=supercontig / SO=protein_coding / is_pseudo=false
MKTTVVQVLVGAAMAIGPSAGAFDAGKFNLSGFDPSKLKLDLGGDFGFKGLFGDKGSSFKKQPVCADFFATADDCASAVRPGWIPVSHPEEIECVVSKKDKTCDPKVCCDPTCETVSREECVSALDNDFAIPLPNANTTACFANKDTHQCDTEVCCEVENEDGNILSIPPGVCEGDLFLKGLGIRIRDFVDATQPSIATGRGNVGVPDSVFKTLYSNNFLNNASFDNFPVSVVNTYIINADNTTTIQTDARRDGLQVLETFDITAMDNEVDVMIAGQVAPAYQTLNACELIVRTESESETITVTQALITQGPLTFDLLSGAESRPLVKTGEGSVVVKLYVPLLDQNADYTAILDFIIDGMPGQNERSRVDFQCGQCPLPPF